MYIQNYNLFYNRENAAFVRENRNFTITCVLDDSQLVCRYNTSDASPLPGRTTCMVNDQKQMPCEYIYIACIII